MEDKDHFTKWYSEQFNQMNAQPPGEVWNEISDNLDVNDVWSGVNSKLRGIERRNLFIRRSSYSLVLLLLLSASGYFFLNDKKTSQPAAQLVHSKNDIYALRNVSVKESIVKPVTASEHTKTLDETSIAETQINKLNHINETIISASAKKETTAVNSTGAFGNKIQKIKNKKSLLTDIATSSANNMEGSLPPPIKIADDFSFIACKDVFVSYPRFDSLTPGCFMIDTPITASDYFKPLLNKNKFKGWYAGGVCSVNNTWLMNYQTLNGLKKNTLNQTNFDYGAAYGFSGGYNFRRNFGIELNYYLNSSEGQSYHLYKEGKYITDKIRMDFTSLNLSAKHLNTGITKWFSLPKSQGMIVGINYGRFKNASETLGSETENVISYYSKSDFGFRFGYEYEILAFKRMLISTGIHTDIGLKNIYSGSAMIPGSFNNTHTALFGINFGVKYLFIH